jgi:uncharacterized protein (TIGR02001 family)
MYRGYTMRNLKALTLGAAIASAFVSTAAVADVTGNIGFVSDYYFRGVQQAASSASAGVDYEHSSGAYAGVWGADVGGHAGASQGIETDVYFGYAGEVSGFSYGLGYTGYYYTGDFDTEYTEVNLTAGYGAFGFEFSSGTHENGAADQDYTFIGLSAEAGDVSFTYGLWGDDFEGAYQELGYSKTVSEIDLGVSIVHGDAEDSPSAGAVNIASDGTALVFSIGKTFDL